MSLGQRNWRWNRSLRDGRRESITIPFGANIAVMGPSGSGKSTLLHSLFRTLSPGDPSQRTDNLEWVDGASENRSRPTIRAYLVEQKDDPVWDSLTVREWWAMHSGLFSPTNDPLPPSSLLDCAGFAADCVLDQAVGTLSGGQRRRLSVSLALLSGVNALLLDEPTSGLASNDVLTWLETMRRLHRPEQTVLMSIHQPRSELLAFVDYWILLSMDGAVKWCGNTNSLEATLRRIPEFAETAQALVQAGEEKQAVAIDRRSVNPLDWVLYLPESQGPGERPSVEGEAEGGEVRCKAALQSSFHATVASLTQGALRLWWRNASLRNQYFGFVVLAFVVCVGLFGDVGSSPWQQLNFIFAMVLSMANRPIDMLPLLIPVRRAVGGMPWGRMRRRWIAWTTCWTASLVWQIHGLVCNLVIPCLIVAPQLLEPLSRSLLLYHLNLCMTIGIATWIRHVESGTMTAQILHLIQATFNGVSVNPGAAWVGMRWIFSLVPSYRMLEWVSIQIGSEETWSVYGHSQTQASWTWHYLLALHVFWAVVAAAAQ